MNFNTIRIFYWVTFALSIFILQLNVGIGLVAMAIIVLPVLGLHVITGIRLSTILQHKALLFLSAFNLLLFVLLRPDGVHTINDNGLSSLLDLFNINAGYPRAYETHFAVGSLILLVVQAIIEIRLWRLTKRNKGALR